MAKPRASYSLGLLVVCEGHEDHRFLSRFQEVRQIPPFHVRKGSTDKHGGGNTEFGRVLGLDRKVNAGFHHLNNVLIITDSDGDEAAAFDSVSTQLVANGFFAPPAPMQVGPGRPAITIMILDGNLECYCKAAAANANAQSAQNVSQFEAVTTHDAWPAHRAGKLWLRASLAARCERDPFVTLGSVFSDARFHDLIPLTDASFNPLEVLLRSLV